MRKPKTRRVLVSINIGGASGRDCLAGILRRVGAGMRWEILFEQDRAKVAGGVRDGVKCDGVITEYAPGELRSFEESGVPVVFTDYSADGDAKPDRATFLRLDDEEIGRTAFRHFASLGKFGSFAFATDDPDAKYSALRLRGFESAAAAAGFAETFRIVRTGRAGGGAGDGAAETLAEMPKPVAVLASYDEAAFAVLGACRRAGLSVPGQVAVLGVDNDEVICANSVPALSSILPDHVRLGARAVDELQRLMNGGRGRTVVLPGSAKEIVRRDSTRVIPPAEHLISAALDFISRSAEKAPTVKDVADFLRVSRPLADLRFRELHGGTIGKAIAAARLDAVKKRLLASRATAGEVAKICSFPSAAALSRFFRREEGVTLSHWRAANAQDPRP